MVEDNKTDDQDTDESTGSAQVISLFLAIGLIIGSLIIGLVIGYVAAPKDSTTAAPNSQTQKAPQLTPDQIQGGKLPPGHPSLPNQGGSQTSTATTPTQ